MTLTPPSLPPATIAPSSHPDPPHPIRTPTLPLYPTPTPTLHPHQVKLFHAAEDGQQTEMGTLPANGHALTFETRDTHGWAAKSFSGITLLELPPGAVRTSQTVDVHECDLNSANRRLHHGWR